MGLFDGFKKLLGLSDPDRSAPAQAGHGAPSAPMSTAHTATPAAPVTPTKLYGQPVAIVTTIDPRLSHVEVHMSHCNPAEPGKENPRAEVYVRFDPKAVGAKGAANMDVVLEPDASASMEDEYAEGRVEQCMASVLDQVKDVDPDGIDVIAHSYAGNNRIVGEDGRLIAKDFGQAATHEDVKEICDLIRLNLGGGTKAAPALRAAAKKRKPDGSLNIQMFTDGEFHDLPEIIQIIREWAQACYEAKRPLMYHLHIIGVGNQLNRAYLEKLDAGLNTPVDIVSLSFEADILNAPEAVLNNLEQSFFVVGPDGEVSVKTDSAEVLKVGNLKANHYTRGKEYFGYEEMPVQLAIGVEFDGRPNDFTIALAWEGGTVEIPVNVG